MEEYKIEWRGNECTNYSSREGNIPIIIVNHIVDGSAGSCDSWFHTAANKQSSAHFLVTFEGEIKQYVRISDMAWANGLESYNIPKAKSAIVRGKNINPNLYSVSIEHEGKTGKLTEKQFQATVWLHLYIHDYVKKTWGSEIVLDRDHIIGHYEVDPLRKPNCPGKDFPWKELISALQQEPKTKPIEKWRYDGIEFLHNNGVLNDLKGWKDKIHDPMPVWAVCLLMKRVMEQFKGKSSE